MTWELIFTRRVDKDSKRLKEAGLKPKASKLLEVLAEDPFKNPPAYEKLSGDLQGLYSRRINIQHRLVYQVFVATKVVHVIQMWSHYE